ncbi:hypothetical protein ERJ75_001181100 [Trypanosoma vivax]|uniref:Uncharacterized protein n=1 Tax=Trypanosoma vivax (strain Y486) TaxID=1055687 RepID=G0UC15_TRYVY|nr:hypothetical protein TRVL_05335 [Trypanosoma vivax]KAH8609661.1 hypothetical protein ERJ75_001181100 [Trypanosoma vivax]CCC53363.1 conserved hypothetical protein [Trypanosoma vivax Y486]
MAFRIDWPVRILAFDSESDAITRSFVPRTQFTLTRALMESPINPNIWKFLFHGSVAALSFTSLFSLYHERYDILSTLDPDVKALRRAKSNDESSAALEAIVAKMKEEAAQSKGITRLCALRHGSTILRFAALQKDGANAEIVSLAIRAIIAVFGKDVHGRRKFYMLGGFRTLIATLSEAHRQGLQSLMEETAEALYELTRVDDSDVVLETDVPMGAEGAYTLARMPATVKMLRLLDSQSPIVFLNSLVGIFANVCTLRVGAQAIGREVEGRSGISYFLNLLSHENQGVVEHCLLAIRYLARAGMGHAELSEEKNVDLLSEKLRPTGDPRAANSILTIVLVMFDSKEARKFFGNLVKTDIICTMFEIWCRAHEKTLRDRAELLVQLLGRVPECTASVQRYLERFRAQINERRMKDDEARRKQLQQMRQNQMMQQMMMENMAMGGGMDLAAMMGGGLE